MTTSLKHLASQINGLPVQDSLKKRLNQYKQVRQQLADSVQALRDTKGQVDGLRILSGKADLLMESEAKKLANVQRRVSALRKLLQSDSPESAELSKHLQPIREAAKGLNNEIQQEWSSICRSDQERAKAFQSLAEKFDPDARIKFDKIITQLDRNSEKPPVTADDLRAVRETRQDLQNTVESLRMEGPVYEFLLNAIRGSGDPKALTDPNVRAYLDQHPVLWQSLRVSFG